MRKYQIVILSFAIGIFLATFLTGFFISRIEKPKIEKVSTEMEFLIQTFFPNGEYEPDLLDCEQVYPVDREVYRNSGNPDSLLGELAYLAMRELLSGPSAEDKALGFFTSINEGVEVKTIVIENGIATVDFSYELEKGVAGSCRVMSIRSQITETLKQFPIITDVIISIEGEREAVLQP